MSYDTKCYELAQAFIEDTNLDRKVHVPRLAQEIQDTIENYIGWENSIVESAKRIIDQAMSEANDGM